MMFAERLRVRRKELGLTVSQCAAFLHKTQPAWTLYETGKRLPKLDELLEICRLLHTTPNDLLGVSQSITCDAVSQDSCTLAAAGAAGRPGLPRANAGELPQCARCPFKAKVKKFEALMAK